MAAMIECVISLASKPNAESGVDRGSDSGVEVEARIGGYVRSSLCRIDPVERPVTGCVGDA